MLCYMLIPFGNFLLKLSRGCSLHLAQRLSQLLNLQLRRMPILSKESAPGLIIATGKCAMPAAWVGWLTQPDGYTVISSSVSSSWCHDIILVTSYYLGCLVGPGVFLAYSSFCVSGSVGKNLASKTNVYISSSAGARWREVSSWFWSFC